MKKFSNTIGVEIKKPEESKLNKEESELESVKYAIYELIDHFLQVRHYGSSRPESSMSTKIVGHEMFAEALIDLMMKSSEDEQIKSLESLKSTNRDWISIDDKINDIESSKVYLREMRNIKKLIEKYGSDKDNISMVMDNNIKRIKSADIALKNHYIAEKMILNKSSNKDVLKVISNKYLERYENLR